MALKKEDESCLELFDAAKKEKVAKSASLRKLDSSRERRSAFLFRFGHRECGIPIPSWLSSTCLAPILPRANRPDRCRAAACRGHSFTLKARNEDFACRYLNRDAQAPRNGTPEIQSQEIERWEQRFRRS